MPKSYDTIQITIEYGRDSLSLDVVVAALRSKELEMKSGNKIMFGGGGDALSVREMSEKREFKNFKSQSRSKSRCKKV